MGDGVTFSAMRSEIDRDVRLPLIAADGNELGERSYRTYSQPADTRFAFSSERKRPTVSVSTAAHEFPGQSQCAFAASWRCRRATAVLPEH